MVQRNVYHVMVLAIVAGVTAQKNATGVEALELSTTNRAHYVTGLANVIHAQDQVRASGVRGRVKGHLVEFRFKLDFLILIFN
jgi:hypothetical protein